jgi:hypothetical protein
VKATLPAYAACLRVNPAVLRHNAPVETRSPQFKAPGKAGADVGAIVSYQLTVAAAREQFRLGPGNGRWAACRTDQLRATNRAVTLPGGATSRVVSGHTIAFPRVGDATVELRIVTSFTTGNTTVTLDADTIVAVDGRATVVITVAQPAASPLARTFEVDLLRDVVRRLRDTAG